MLSYERIDVSESIDVNETSTSKECIICYQWYFLNKKFMFQPTVCNSSHKWCLLDINGIVVLNIHGVD